MGQWVDEGTAKYEWTTVEANDGYVRLRNVADDTLYLTATTDGGVRMTALSESDGQLWRFTEVKDEEPEPDPDPAPEPGGEGPRGPGPFGQPRPA